MVNFAKHTMVMLISYCICLIKYVCTYNITVCVAAVMNIQNPSSSVDRSAAASASQSVARGIFALDHAVFHHLYCD